MKVVVKKNNLWFFCVKNWQWIVLLLLFTFEVFLRAYQIETKNPFGYDQVSNAWAVKNIIVNHRFPFVGPAAKQNTGFYIGPLYYYLLAIFYFFTNLDPIASGIFAATSSVFTFFALFFVMKRLFSFSAALIATFIQTVSFYAIIFDKVEWNVDFLPGLSFIILYFLYKIITGNIKYIFPLAIAMGIMFHVHFTAIIFIPIVLFTLPFFSWSKKTVFFIILAMPLFFIWFIPNFFFEIQHKSTQSLHLLDYFNKNFLGFHLRRMMQLTGDALIQFNPFLFFPQITFLKFVIFPFFLFFYLFQNITKNRLLLCYLFLLWFLMPWVIFSTYRGEISDYYFSINRFIALASISYIIARLITKRQILIKIGVIGLLAFYAYVNLVKFTQYQDVGILKRRDDAVRAIQEGRTIQYQEGVPEAYFYYFYMRKAHRHVSYE